MKSYLLRKKKDAVSPVIATILMVAITVVLAAVLYVMVMGFGGGQTSTPTGTINVTTGIRSGSTGFANITFGQINPTVKYADCKVTIVNTVGTPTTYISNAMTTVVGGPATGAVFATGSLVGAGISAGQTGNINVGDTMQISGTSLAAGSYTFTLLYVPTGGVIASKTVTLN
jgi:flagellin-like protein